MTTFTVHTAGNAPALVTENPTIREIAGRISNAGTGPVMAGTQAEIADEMEAWYAAGAADGLQSEFPLLPHDWLNFAEFVAPELQRRGRRGRSIRATGCVIGSACPSRPTASVASLPSHEVHGNQKFSSLGLR